MDRIDMARLWRLDNPQDYDFAQAFATPEQHPEVTGQSLVIEWEPSSDVIGDFTWARGIVHIMVKERVAEELRARFHGFGFGSVEMTQNPKLRRPHRVMKRGRGRVWLPYEGPPLYRLQVEAWVSADLERSTLTFLDIHPDFGYRRYRLEGHEHDELRGEYPEPVISERVPRRPGKGLYVPEQALAAAGIFFLEQMRGWTFCTDPVRDFILEQRYTNVDFYEVGETF